MRDGLTRKKNAAGEQGRGGLSEFLDGNSPSLVVVSGPSAGMELRLDRERVLVGRGPGVQLEIDDPEVSRQHASLEFQGDGFRVRDLNSTNGVLLRGTPIQVADLTPGDRFRVGDHVIQYVVVEAEPEPDVYELSSEP